MNVSDELIACPGRHRVCVRVASGSLQCISTVSERWGCDVVLLLPNSHSNRPTTCHLWELTNPTVFLKTLTYTAAFLWPVLKWVGTLFSVSFQVYASHHHDVLEWVRGYYERKREGRKKSEIGNRRQERSRRPDVSEMGLRWCSWAVSNSRAAACGVEDRPLPCCCTCQKDTVWTPLVWTSLFIRASSMKHLCVNPARWKNRPSLWVFMKVYRRCERLWVSVTICCVRI